MATRPLQQLERVIAGFSSHAQVLLRRLKGNSRQEIHRLVEDLRRIAGLIPMLSTEIGTRYEQSSSVLEPLAEASHMRFPKAKI